MKTKDYVCDGKSNGNSSLKISVRSNALLRKICLENGTTAIKIESSPVIKFMTFPVDHIPYSSSAWRMKIKKKTIEFEGPTSLI